MKKTLKTISIIAIFLTLNSCENANADVKGRPIIIAKFNADADCFSDTTIMGWE